MSEHTPNHLDEHARIAELLPFHARGALDRREAADVADHLAHCGACQALFEDERRLTAAFATLAARPIPDPGPGLARLLARIESDASVGTAGTGTLRVVPFGAQTERAAPRDFRIPYAAAAVLVLTVTLAALSAVRVAPSSLAPAYRTLSNAASAGPARGTLNLVLEPTRTRADLERLLAGLPVSRIEPRALAGAWQVELQNGSASRPLLEAAAARLRAADGVLFAAPAPARAERTPQ